MLDEVRITDRAGVSWSAREIPASHLTFNDEVMGDHAAHLCFEPLHDTAGPARTVRRYRADWRSLPGDALLALLDEATPVARAHARCVDDAELRRHLDALST